ncbi:MAG: porin family protein [Desulfobacterales bacterium]|nr:porin family protein [Desulfobacterales bacterium]
MRIALSALFILGLTLILSLPNAALAQNSPNYATLKLGGFFPTDDLDDADFDSGFTGEIAYGRYLFPYLALEAGVGYYETEMSVKDPGYPGIGYSKEENEIKVIPFTLTVKGVYTVSKLELYGGVGGGFYFADVDGKVRISGYGNISLSDSDTVGGGHVVLGLNYNITERFFLGVEGKGVWTGDAEFKDEFLGSPISVETDLNGYTIMAAAGFRF